MLEGVRNRLLDSKKGKKVQNGFVIISDESDNGAGGSSGTKTAKGRGTTKANDRSSEPALSADVDEDSTSTIIAEIEQHHSCEEHRGKACVLDNRGHHYQLTINDLTVWAEMVKKHRATVTELPEKLDLSTKMTMQRRIKAAAQVTDMPPNPWMSYGPPPWSYYPPPPPPCYPPYPAGPSNLPLPPTHEKPTTIHSPIASPRKRKLPIVNPTIGDWLQSLDLDTEDRGRDHLDFSQYTEALTQEGIYRLSDFRDLETPEKLMELLPILRWGVANRLLKHAREDVEVYEREAKRSRITE
ncbi:hypothetical protein VKT23_013047 [Stygiomarasmius scandens]|uniref:SAM domain-containing protein n=1 Tax=Marasmiellus scandens TaxID=2682957 RepID=A0ABR1J987_9AGAR